MNPNLSTAPAEPVVRLEKARTVLSIIWLGGAGISLTILVFQSLLGHYGSQTQDVWGWYLPTVMPTLGLILSGLGYTALSPSSDQVVRSLFFRISVGISVVYQILVLLTILIQPLVDSPPIQLMNTSSLWLGPCQGLAASALGVLFVSKKQSEQKAASASGSSA